MMDLASCPLWKVCCQLLWKLLNLILLTPGRFWLVTRDVIQQSDLSLQWTWSTSINQTCFLVQTQVSKVAEFILRTELTREILDLPKSITNFVEMLGEGQCSV